MKFILEIKLGNDAMQTYEDIRDAIANRMQNALPVPARLGDTDTIRDLNGNTVGKWEVTEKLPTTPRVVLTVEGGLIQQIFADRPIDVATVDYDVEGGDEDRMIMIPQGEYEGKPLKDEPAFAGIQKADILPADVQQMFDTINAG